MKRNMVTVFVLCLSIAAVILTGCGGEEGVSGDEIASSLSPTREATRVPTVTAATTEEAPATKTVRPTFTPAATETKQAKMTPVPTSTNMPKASRPEAATAENGPAVAKKGSLSGVAVVAYEEDAALTSTPEATDMPLRQPTSTESPTEVPPTATAIVVEGDLAQVVRVIDGDTIVVNLNGAEEHVRYIGMDTPERGEVCFEEAAWANSGLVAGQTVRLVMDQRDRDRNSRLLRYVYVGDTFVNEELVRQGWAVAKQYPPDTAMAGVLERAEIGAPSTYCQIAEAAAPAATKAPVAELAPTQAPAATEPAPVPTQPAPAPTEAPADVVEVVAGLIQIAGVDKRAEFVDIVNSGGAVVDLGGWRLVSEKGNQGCSLGGQIGPGSALRIWAMAEDAGKGGFNCQFGKNIWNNSEHDPAVLYDPSGNEVARR